MTKQIAKDLIREIKSLRILGYSLPEISEKTGVSKTSIFRYAKDVEVGPEYLQSLKSKRGGSARRRERKELAALEDAKLLLGNLHDNELLLFLSALYWGEGSKRDFQLSNTDSQLIRLFVNGLRQILKVEDNRLAISIRIYEDLDSEKCLDFWSEVVGIPKEKFLAVNVLKGKKLGKLSYGMCRVRVRKGSDLLKKIVGINKIVAQSLPL